MEQAAGQEIKTPEVNAKDRLRAVQRQKILHDHFKNPSKLELLMGIIPSDKPMPNTAVDAAGLRHFAEALGKHTHTALFELAATSKNPMELYNIILNISNLKKVESSYWKFEDSEDHFLKRKLPEYVDVSEDAKDQAEAMSSDSQHLLESFFYTISTENVPLEDKRRILRDFYTVKTLLPPISGNEVSQKIYGPGSSFWSHVDGSWIDPDLAPVQSGHGQANKPSVVSSVAKGMKGRLDRLAEEITQAPQITTLEGLLKKSYAKVVPLTEEAKDLRILLDREVLNNQHLAETLATSDLKSVELSRTIGILNKESGNLRLEIDELRRRLSENTGDLQRQLDAKSTEASRLQSQLDSARTENQDLQRRLREAQRQQAQARSPQGQPKKTPFEILKVSPSATSREIVTAYRRLVRGLHPDTVVGKLKNAGVDTEATDEIGQLAEECLKDINIAYEDLRKIGRVQ